MTFLVEADSRCDCALVFAHWCKVSYMAWPPTFIPPRENDVVNNSRFRNNLRKNLYNGGNWTGLNS